MSMEKNIPADVVMTCLIPLRPLEIILCSCKALKTPIYAIPLVLPPDRTRVSIFIK